MGKEKKSIYFIKQLFLFALPLVLIFVVIELRMRSIPNGYEVKRQYLEKSIDSIEVLVLGNSHMVQGVDPDLLGRKAFNLASSSQSYFYDKELTFRYIDRLKRLKFVIIPVDYFSFYYSLHDIADWLDYGYDKFWGIHFPELSVWDSRSYFYTMLYTPANSLNYSLKGKDFNLAGSLRTNGYTPVDVDSKMVPFIINDKTGRVRAQFHKRMIRPERFDECMSNLNELIKNLVVRSVKVILVESPVFNTYSKFCDTSILLNNRKLAQELAIKYNCVFRSYFSDNRFGLDDFSDNDHLNSKGAKKFASILNEDFISK